MRFHAIKDSLITFVKELIRNRYHCNNDFETWTYSAIKEAYVGKFKTELELKDDVDDRLYFAGENLEFAMKSFVLVNQSIALENILEFAELFMKKQFDQFDSWCHEVHVILNQPI
jgi:hypothetical protein